ncbi:MAG: ABC transporter substrate-binding protein, partial [Coriobacteriales bacterium]
MKTLKRTAFALAAVTALTSLLSLAACGDPPKNRITLSVWTYYNNQQDSAFRRIIDEFNDTEGKEKAIYVTSSSYSNPTKIAEEVEKNAKKELPEIFQLYSDDLKKIDDAHQNVASLEGYFTQAEKDLYVDNFFSEGYINGGLKLVSTAKSTELFMMNKTDWDAFAEDYNKSASEEEKVSLEDLSTAEGIAATAEKYYFWSGGDDGGKAFFGRDAYAN